MLILQYLLHDPLCNMNIMNNVMNIYILVRSVFIKSFTCLGMLTWHLVTEYILTAGEPTSTTLIYPQEKDMHQTLHNITYAARVVADLLHVWFLYWNTGAGWFFHGSQGAVHSTCSIHFVQLTLGMSKCSDRLSRCSLNSYNVNHGLAKSAAITVVHL